MQHIIESKALLRSMRI